MRSGRKGVCAGRADTKQRKTASLMNDRRRARQPVRPYRRDQPVRGVVHEKLPRNTRCCVRWPPGRGKNAEFRNGGAGDQLLRECPAPKMPFARRQPVPASKWCWSAFAKQSRVISPEWPRHCPNRTLDGHWWLQATLRPCTLLQAFSDGGGTIGTDAEAAIDRYHGTPQQYYGRAVQLNPPRRQVSLPETPNYLR